MPEIRVICSKIKELIADTREKASSRQWRHFSRRAFVYNLANIIPDLEELLLLINEIKKEIEKSGGVSKPDIETLTEEFNKLITILNRNRQMEESKIEKSKQQGISELADNVTVPELYSDLEQKTLSLLLKTSYFVERARIFERKKSPIMKTSATQRNILDLLDKRDQELFDLKKKYDETRKNSFLGLVEKESSIEIEHELNEVSRKLEAKTALMKKNFENTKETFEQFQNQITETHERILNVEELGAQLTGKTFELITMLKKERDYVKKVLIEIEQDTLQLRNTYSKELLGLQEEKISIRNELEEKYDARINELKLDLKEKSQLLKHFQEISTNKEKKIALLEEENRNLQLAKKVLEKHEKIKEQILGKKKHPTEKKEPLKKKKKTKSKTKKKIVKKH